jgi:hypothetical protein
MTEAVLRGVPLMDVTAGLTQSARIAHDEGMSNTGRRCEELAKEMRNGYRHMVALCPKGFSVQVDMVFRIVPDVNWVLNDDVAPFHGYTVD